MNIPENLVYSSEHEWCRVEGDTVVIGITDFAQGELGDVVFIELPDTGSSTVVGEEFGTIEAVKAVAELYAPLNGEVLEINDSVVDSPEMVNEDPYGNGWMIKIRINDPAELNALLSAEAYGDLIGEGGE
jgi:glycine cleavage system H protein